MKKTIIFFLLLSISIGISFHMNNRIIDKIHIVNVVGYDYVDPDRFRGTVVIPVFKPDKTIKNTLFTGVSSLIYENRNKLNTQSSRPLLSGKLQVVLFNEELARHGIFDYLDSLERDPTIGSRIDLAIVEGSTEEMLKKDYEGIPSGLYFSSLLRHNTEKGSLPKSNLHLFSKNFYSEGIDPVLPLLSQKGDKIQINGIALFKKDKYVDKLNYYQTVVFSVLHENFSRGIFLIKDQDTDEEIAAVDIIQSERKITIEKQFPSPKITIYTDISGHIREYKKEAINNKTVKKMEKQMEKEVEIIGKEMIKKFQELTIDPLGLGQAVKNHFRNWNQAEWLDQYPNIEVNIKATVDITEAGIVK